MRKFSFLKWKRTGLLIAAGLLAIVTAIPLIAHAGGGPLPTVQTVYPPKQVSHPAPKPTPRPKQTPPPKPTPTKQSCSQPQQDCYTSPDWSPDSMNRFVQDIMQQTDSALQQGSSHAANTGR
ncbi:MAG: hypothetical protein IMW89_04160 [Ktedonobacteraceae bacterium]|nr:hypothetical protein [Ktedonobacteraceae bacterium]